MSKLVLKRLTFVNFKGFSGHRLLPSDQEFTIDFTKVTQVNGDNGTGKTTVFDGYNWLLYGRDSHGDTQFSIKTLDLLNNPISKLEHSVEGIFDLNGKEFKLKKEYREKWQTVRGTTEERMNGHDTKYFIDDVIVSKSQYEYKVSEILDPSVSNMISNPAFFNEEMHWKDRRAILSKMAGEITGEEITETASEPIQYAVDMLSQGKNLEDERKRLSTKRKNLKDELKLIPSRIEEVKRMTPESKDFASIMIEIQELDKQMKEIDDTISDLNQAYQTQAVAIDKKRKEKAELTLEFSRLESENKSKHSDRSKLVEKKSKVQQECYRIECDITSLREQIEMSNRTIESKNQELNMLRVEYREINDRSFDDSKVQTSCPACNRELDDAAEKIEVLRLNFNTDKSRSLEINKHKGLKLKEDIESIIKKNKELESQIENLDKELKEKQIELDEANRKMIEPVADPEPTQEMIDLEQKIDSFVIDDTIKQPDTSELMERRKELESQRDEKKKVLSSRDIIEANTKRIEELEQSRRAMSQEVAEIEGIEFEIDHYIKTKINLVEDRVNSMFSIVKFKMFKDQVNGGQEAACECLVEGVPYKSVNQADQVKAGLDIISTLQRQYEVNAPVFVDRKESIVVLPEFPFQVVYLKVDPSAKQLEVLNIEQ